MKSFERPRSLPSNAEENEAGDLTSGAAALVQLEKRTREAFEDLTPQQRDVLALRYGLRALHKDAEPGGWSRDRIADFLGVSKTRIKTLQEIAEDKLRNHHAGLKKLID